VTIKCIAGEAAALKERLEDGQLQEKAERASVLYIHLKNKRLQSYLLNRRMTTQSLSTAGLYLIDVGVARARIRNHNRDIIQWTC